MQRVTFLYKSPNSTRDLNNHIAKLLAPGAYHGLEVVPADPVSMKVSLVEGYACTDEGIKIEETTPLTEFITVPTADPNFPRIDMIVLRHRYDPTLNPNVATYHLIQGVPTPPPDQPMPKMQDVQPGDIILCDIMVDAGATAIDVNSIFNRYRTLTTSELRAEIAEALYMAVGNFCYEGWDLSSDHLNVMVSPGRGLLGGWPNESLEEFIITTLRAREFLYGPYDPDIQPPTLYQVGPNLTLNKQPDYPSKLRITVTATTVPTAGTIYITGRNEFGEQVNNSPVYINVPAGQSVTVETAARFAEVYHEGIDAHELIRAGANPTIYIKDKPVHYIYAVGTESGRAIFKAILDPAYHAPPNEYLLGWAETDETHVIELVRWTTVALADVDEDLSPQCDGFRRTFTLLGIPRANSELVIYDGSVLHKGAPKGYTIVNNIITLGAALQTPDGDADPLKHTDLWVRYKRQG